MILMQAFCNTHSDFHMEKIALHLVYQIIFHIYYIPDFFSNSTPAKYNLSHDWNYFDNHLFLADFDKNRIKFST